MRARLAIVGLTVFALFACGKDRQPAPTTPTPTAAASTTSSTTTSIPPPVRGTVVDFQTAKPIVGAVVGFATDFFVAPVGMTQTAVTDANGRYSLPEPPLRSGVFGYYILVVNNQYVGRGYPRGVNVRSGDVAVHIGPCVTRYGMMLDSQTYLPIVGASVGSPGGGGTA